MAEHILKINCGCDHTICKRALHIVSAPGRKRAIVSLTNNDEYQGNITLDKEGIKTLALWLLELPDAQKEVREALERAEKKHKMNKKREKMPWY